MQKTDSDTTTLLGDPRSDRSARVRGRLDGRARFYDCLGRHFIAAAGIGTIAAILGIFVFIVSETYPLFGRVEVRSVGTTPLPPSAALAVGIDPYREVSFTIGEEGLQLRQVGSEELLRLVVPTGLDNARITAAYHRDGQIALGLGDGRALIGAIDFDIDFVDGKRVVSPRVAFEEPVAVHSGQDASVRIVCRYDGDSRSTLASISAEGDLTLVIRTRQRSLLGSGKLEQQVYDLTEQVPGEVLSIVVDGPGSRLLAGTDTGQVIEWRIRDSENSPAYSRILDVSRYAITALEFLLGDVSLVVGDASGGLTVWFDAFHPGESSVKNFQPTHQLHSHDTGVTCIAPSSRDKQFLTGTESGRVALHHSTSEQTFFDIDVGVGAVVDVALTPKGDGFLVLGSTTELARFDLLNPHPEITLQSLFSAVWYEGYQEPEHVWQSTGGTDEFEPKLSLVPLIFGTVKGTVYALLFALPLAVLAAMYTAEFSRPEVRNVVKPAIEMMASLPSVILGFLAGLWLAPLVQYHVVGVAALLGVIPLLVFATSCVWHLSPRRFRRHIPKHGEFTILIVVVAAGVAAALSVGPVLERLLFDGGFETWLNTAVDMRYDQRNSIVIGLAMGFAVIPLIFTIFEDALSSVPHSLRAGSLALGATPWQTAVKVVLPMALPGLFSATLIGFGRAIGETMIVLMATGNTPIMEWSVFNGMRTISANIAVELPEAPHEDTLYRVLFLSGLLLFVVTFVVNSLAEGVRQHLREKYERV